MSAAVADEHQREHAGGADEAPFATYVSGVRTDFFSARMGCQVEHPLYGIDLAALCVRD